eukprot:TRINITY_DN59846_c0_g2_i1.p1 TRINITY_DN59846_c0_g2~~TRINITY_DN59846_c0_g2_i1.p1  ORF type:complete len:282 (-),score=21.28 TRINITY_DN59846_c0_g2_i1:364-1209(-)
MQSASVRSLVAFLRQTKHLCVITGAGISTDSGLGAYSGPGGAYERGYKPISQRDFTNFPAMQRRYWSRAFCGWKKFSQAQPNGAHQALAKLEDMGIVHNLITQNVDRLHQKAGQQRVIDLHGSIHDVICLSCKDVTQRSDLQQKLADANPAWIQYEDRGWSEKEQRPDGDVEVGIDPATFEVPPCEKCGGALKPHVVLFGGAVPPHVVDNCKDIVAQCDGILVLGSSLKAWSARRHVITLQKQGMPLAIINETPTPYDDWFEPALKAGLTGTLEEAVKQLL